MTAVCYPVSGGGNGSKAEVSALPSKYSDVGTRWDSGERGTGKGITFRIHGIPRCPRKSKVPRMLFTDVVWRLWEEDPVRKCVLDGTSALLIHSPPLPLDGRRLDVAKL